MLKVENLTSGYGKKTIIKNISFNVNEGEIACLLGQNGCGKTTLLKSILKILPPSSGSVYVNGESILNKKRKDIAKHISLMAGQNTAYFSYTVFQTVLLGRYARNKKNFLSESFTKADKEKVSAILEKLNLYELREKPLTQLSSGQCQKVFLARTFVQDTPVILLDEPTSHLDLKAQIDIYNELKKLTSEQQVSVLAVLHDINLALNLADRIILLKSGTLQENTLRKNLNLKKLNSIYETDVVNFMQQSFKLWH